MTSFQVQPQQATDAATAAEIRFAEGLYRQFIGRENRYAVYPIGWPEAWGRAPMLGTVIADDEDTALYRAYDLGIARPDCFKYRFKLLGQANTTQKKP